MLEELKGDNSKEEIQLTKFNDTLSKMKTKEEWKIKDFYAGKL